MKPASPALEVRPVTTNDEAGYPTADELGSGWMQEDGGQPIIGPALASALLSALGMAGCGTSASPASTAPAPRVAEPPATVLQPAPVSTLATAPEPEPEVAPEPEPAPAAPAATNAGTGLPHAFSWEKSALPIEWHPYGTGEPARLNLAGFAPAGE